MPLASLFNLQYYGSASGAMVAETPVIVSQLSISGVASAEVDVVITNPTSTLKATRLVNSPIEVQGLGVMQEATPKGRARATLDVSIGAVPSAFDNAQAVLNALAASYNIAGTIGAKINASGSGGGGGGGGTIIRDDELAQGGNKRTIRLNNAASSTNNLYEGSTVVIMSGTGAGQARKITRYTAATKTADVSPTFTTAPDSTSVYRIIP
jgi:hypothetical protein